LDLLGGDSSNGNRLGLWDCYNGDNQQWGYDPDMLTIYLASSATSDATKCLQLGDLHCHSHEPCWAPLEIWDCNGGEMQLWQIDNHTQYRFEIPSQEDIHLFNDGGCLHVGGDAGVNGAPVQMQSCHHELPAPQLFQEWTSLLFSSFAGGDTIRFSGEDHGSGTPDGTHCLDVSGGQLIEGQAVWLWECKSDLLEFQKWRWNSSVGYKSRLSLDIHPSWCLEGSDIEGTYPFIAPCSDSKAQVWRSPLPHPGPGLLVV